MVAIILEDLELKLVVVKPEIDDAALEVLDRVVDTVGAEDDPGQLVSP